MTRSQIRLGVVVSSVLVAAFASIVGCDSDSTTPKAGTSSSSGGTSSGGGTSSSSGGSDAAPTIPTIKAGAEIKSTGVPGQTPAGSILFEETKRADGGTTTKVTVNITGATPGNHGLHIHQTGSCDPVDGGAALAAGGHWNPLDAGHSFPEQGNAGALGHMGDLGNINIGADGTGKIETTSTIFSVDGAFSVVDKAVIFHAQNDNGEPPVGNAGARPGCGIIKKQ